MRFASNKKKTQKKAIWGNCLHLKTGGHPDNLFEDFEAAQTMEVSKNTRLLDWHPGGSECVSSTSVLLEPENLEHKFGLWHSWVKPLGW